MAADRLRVEVAYALPDRQTLLALDVDSGCTVYEAAVKSEIVDLHPEIDLTSAAMGVFGRVVTRPRQEPVQDGDRVEIYRPLIVDPKEARRARAARGLE